MSPERASLFNTWPTDVGVKTSDLLTVLGMLLG
jgi:hypothetical protein